MTSNQDNHQPAEELDLEECLHWFEFACWTAIALFPFLYWVNGAAVSTE